MQANLARSKAALGVRSAGRLAILAGVPFIATLALLAPDRALAACGATHPAGVHASTGGGVHVASARPATSGGGGGGTLGCANGASAPALHALPAGSSGRVVERGVHPAARTATTATHARAATTRTNAGAHTRVARPPHHA